MELPADAKVGQPAWEYLKLEDDYVIGIGLTPNRIDAASHIGVEMCIRDRDYRMPICRN